VGKAYENTDEIDEDDPDAPKLAALSRLTSNGYVRSNLYVLQGGKNIAGGSASTMSSTTTLLKHMESNVQSQEKEEGHAETEGTTVLKQMQVARMKGYEGDSCQECGNFTLVRNGTCLKCVTCGSTSGCS
jgi:ribonucleoside-diphosphate reductase alpha chain